MIKLQYGVSIFDTDANIIVNPVNTVGKMGKGLALEFKKRFYKNFLLYRDACAYGHCAIGKVFITYSNNADGLAIINFPTKEHWSGDTQLEWISLGLQDMRQYLHAGDTVALPMLGCGLGGLRHHQDVLFLIDHWIGKIPDVDVIVCATYKNKLAEFV